MKECLKCKEIKSIEEFHDIRLVSGYGNYCNRCKKKKPKILPTYDQNKENPIKDLEKIKCPICYSKMVLRERRIDKYKFYGCSNYPVCRGTKNYKNLTD